MAEDPSSIFSISLADYMSQLLSRPTMALFRQYDFRFVIPPLFPGAVLINKTGLSLNTGLSCLEIQSTIFLKIGVTELLCSGNEIINPSCLLNNVFKSLMCCEEYLLFLPHPYYTKVLDNLLIGKLLIQNFFNNPATYNSQLLID